MLSEKQITDLLNTRIKRKIDNETLASESMVYKVGIVYGFYRIIVSIFLIFSNIISNSIAKTFDTYANMFSSETEYKIMSIYLIISIVFLVFFYFQKKQIRNQLLVGLVFDVLALALLMYSGIAKDLQISLLLMVVSASSFMLLEVRNAIIISLLAILSFLFQQVYHSIFGIDGFFDFGDTMMVSISLMVVGAVSWVMSQRIAIAERRTLQKNQEIEQLQNINEQAIKHIPNGLIVFNNKNQIAFINTAAVRMLKLNFTASESVLSKNFIILNHIAKFDVKFVDWYQNTGGAIFYFLKIPQTDTEPASTLKVSKRELDGYGKMLVFEDELLAEVRAQSLKLQSLGQLSASIAHEIKNPLSGISQASQLLKEFSNKNDPTFELVEIIDTQTKRVTRIIDDIVRLSKQEPPSQELIHLKSWLPYFIEQYYKDASIGLYFHTDKSVMFDPNHLEQVMTNLLNNALRHTQKQAHLPDVQVVVHANEYYACIDVMDHGEGVPADYVSKLFTPFFTKSQNGTGLGLYLCKAFSEANHAHLMYLPNYEKSCFRLLMPIEVHVLE